MADKRPLGRKIPLSGNSWYLGRPSANCEYDVPDRFQNFAVGRPRPDGDACSRGGNSFQKTESSSSVGAKSLAALGLGIITTEGDVLLKIWLGKPIPLGA